jgi:hypothetical protein
VTSEACDLISSRITVALGEPQSARFPSRDYSPARE